MATQIVVPRLGWTMEEGIFGEWLQEDGAAIRVGDLLYTMETDKATQEVEALESGILRIAPDAPQTGDVVPVGALLGYLVAENEDPPFGPETETPVISNAAQATAHQTPVPTVQTTTQAARSESRRNGPAISPRARRIAQDLGVEWRELEGSGRTGRIIERDVRAFALESTTLQNTALESATPVRVSPVARRIAEEAGIDPATVAPEKTGGRVQRRDVEAAIAARVGQETHAPEPAHPEGTAIPADRVRRLIARRMANSAHTTAAVTLITEADATDLVAQREQFKSALAPRGIVVPGYNDILIKIVATILPDYPLLNASWHESGNETEIRVYDAVHVGLAVDSEGGLIVPVVRDAHTRSLRSIAAQTRDLIEKARAGTLAPEEIQGSTFTITNLGMYGIDAFTPIINLPQTAILGVGRIQTKPAVFQGQIVPRHLLTLSLTFDHRAVDGGPAARFMDAIREHIETPALWLAG